MKIIGHHTCSSNGNLSDIEDNGPFLSQHVEGKPSSHKFLGTGYYFWDNNIGMAHAHGQSNYKRRYHIFEAELDIPDDQFLDLAGNRVDMLHFQEVMEIIKENYKITSEWTLAHFIEFLKKIGLFSYRVVRAVDTSINPKKVTKFVAERQNYINLNPIFIVCTIDKRKDLIKSFKHLKTFPADE